MLKIWISTKKPLTVEPPQTVTRGQCVPKYIYIIWGSFVIENLFKLIIQPQIKKISCLYKFVKK